ncbi:unnamed protein product [Mycena citricolor]|uniref:Transcription factor domain-containing protein n=1 Tax=Mycena citricolor TaxID=2018698 RepID=A0AAD2HE08_9AGAR|nr:unnamed protein product [Mycena citricolor]
MQLMGHPYASNRPLGKAGLLLLPIRVAASAPASEPMEGPPTSFSFQAGYEHPTSTPPDDDPDKAAGSTVPKRKRLTKVGTDLIYVLATLVIKAKGDAMVQVQTFLSIAWFTLNVRVRSAPRSAVQQLLFRLETLPVHGCVRSGGFCTPSRQARRVQASSGFFLAFQESGGRRAGAFYISVLLDMGESHQARKRAKTKPSSQTLPINHEGPSDPVCIEDGTAGCISAAAVLDIGTTRELTNQLILQIVETLLGTQSEMESIQATLERECLRRISWVVYVAELQLSIWTQRPALLAESQLHSRLPVDETCFELAPLAGVAEYLHTPGQHTSEWGHLVRIYPLYAQAELNLGRSDLSLSALTDLEKSGEDWVSNLPEALQFSEQNLQVQISMFETASNTGAWCFCYMHILFTGLSLALHSGKYLLSHVPVSQKPPWAVSRLDLLLGALGDRAKNSMICEHSNRKLHSCPLLMLCSGIISLGERQIQIRHLGREDIQLRKLCSEYEAASGTRIIELASAASFPPRTPMLLPPASQSLLPSRSLNDLRVHRQSSWSNSYPPIGSLPLAVEGEMKPIGRLAESLPSLKSSGLLDSWNPAHNRPGGEGSSNSRSGPPVGLQWLANESR